jgi:hypothetical protein
MRQHQRNECAVGEADGPETFPCKLSQTQFQYRYEDRRIQYHTTDPQDKKIFPLFWQQNIVKYSPTHVRNIENQSCPEEYLQVPPTKFAVKTRKIKMFVFLDWLNIRKAIWVDTSHL